MGFQVQVLGISSATPTITRSPTAQVLTFRKSNYLLDCGEGTQTQFLKFGAKMYKVDKIFISHLHPDHFAGLLTMLTTMAMGGRKNPIEIYCPIGLKQIIEIPLYYSGGKLPFKITYQYHSQKEIETIFEDDYIIIKTIKLLHGIDCWGFLFQEKLKYLKIDKSKLEGFENHPKACSKWRVGKDYIDENGNTFPAKDYTFHPVLKSYAYITDTLYLEDIAKHLKGVHTLYHESTYLEDSEEKASLRFHSTAKQAGKMAHLSDAQQLILGHFSARYGDLSYFGKEAQEEVDEAVIIHVGKEGEIYKI